MQEAALKCVQELAGEDADEFAVETIQGTAENSEDAGRIVGETVQALQTLPFFGGGKTVWLKGANFLGDTVTGRSKSTQAAVERLLELLLGGLPPDVNCVISAVDIDKRRRFFLQLKQRVQMFVFDKPDIGRPGWEEPVMEQASARARRRGLTFTGTSLELFVMTVGEDSRQLENELEKLDLYLGERREIGAGDVREVVSLTRGGVVFEIGNALAQRDLPRTLALMDHLLYRGESAIGILLAAVVPQVRRMLQARDLEKSFGIRATGSFPAFQAAVERLPDRHTTHIPRKKDGKPNCYPLFLAARDARRFSPGELRAGLEACLKANLRLVRTGLDPKLVLHQLVVQLLAPAEKRRENHVA